MNFTFNIDEFINSNIIVDEPKTHFTFDDDFNQPLPLNYIPPSVSHVRFGHSFNQPLTPIGNCIPSSVSHLVFGYEFNQPLTSNCIPFSVKYLYFRSIFDYRSSAHEIIMNPEIEINFHASNIFYPKNRVVQLYHWGHD